MMLRRSAGLAGVMLTVGAWAQEVDLDKPIVRTPTVRSEIKKGSDYAFYCYLGIKDKTNARSYVERVQKARRTDELTVPSSPQ